MMAVLKVVSSSPNSGKRRRISLRWQIGLGFALCFLLALSVTLAAFWLLLHLQVKIQALSLTDYCSIEVQQARRFEKNYFLYRSNLDDALIHVNTAIRLFQANPVPLVKMVGAARLRQVQEAVEAYKTSLERLASQAALGAIPSEKLTEFETELRRLGAEMVTQVLRLGQEERQTIDDLLRRAKQVPLFFLLALLTLMVFWGHRLSRTILGPLARLQRYTQRIAQGEFVPLTPIRPYQDEFSDLAEALNRMVAEISQRQQALVQSQKLKAVGTLTAGIAHELNNPINNIMLLGHLLQENWASYSEAQRQEALADLMQQAQRCQNIIRQLLDFTRESEAIQEPLDLAELVQETVKLAANQVRLAGAQLELDLIPNLPHLHGDRQQLSQVILNLLLNALDAIPPGGKVRISLGRNGDQELYLAVTDNGPGIPPDILPQIFDPFFTTKPPGHGTGLGLAVSQGIVARHGGRIEVASHPDTGTTVTVIFPVTTLPLTNRSRPMLG